MSFVHRIATLHGSPAVWLLLALTLFGCASNPPGATRPTASPLSPPGLNARLTRPNGQYQVTGICRQRTPALAQGASRYAECPTEGEMKGMLYFNLTTLEPVAEPFGGCLAWGEKEGEKQSAACEELKDLYSTDVTANILFAPIAILGSLTQSAGTRMGKFVELDEAAFRSAVEQALPTPRRQAVLDEESAWREAAPVRAQAAAQQAQVVAQATRLQQQRQLQSFAERVREVNGDAERRFRQLSAAAKVTGTTVCSADNRIGYVEQVAGPRVRVLQRGRAVAELDAVRDQSNVLGPFEVDASGLPPYSAINPDYAHVEVPVTDMHYLFKPHRTVRIAATASSSGTIWDESRFWGACDWRV